jgi:hypothetical protein
MNQQPDKFFRDKLEHYQKPAPSSAWDKIAAAQTKKNDKGLWLKIAASLLLLTVAGYVLWPSTTSVEQPENTLSEIPATQSPSDSTKKQATEDNSINTELNAEAKNNLQATAEKKTEKTFSKPRSTPKNEPERKTVTVVKDEEQPESQIINGNPAVAVESTETIITELNKEKETQNITLIYSAKEVDEYLDKNALAEATSRDKKPSTLKKLLQKANDLKNNQDPFGELRQKKNEILALNFKNEKRGQNK